MSGLSSVTPGPWLAKAEFDLPPLDSAAQASYPLHPPMPGPDRAVAAMLYNGMVHPLLPYSIRGILWYQGEANLPRAAQYRTEFTLLIKDWRAKWSEGDIPFYFCQLANMNGKYPMPLESSFAELREAQTAALALPQTGQAVLIDLGEPNDIHFRDKKDAGERVAAIALANTYGKAVPFSGPVYQSMTVEGSAIRIHFQSPDPGLVARDLPATYALKSTLPADQPLVRNSPNSPLQGFTICGDDHKWVWADARIDGNTVLVSSTKVPNPIAVRYAWADNPTCNLVSSAGLPACPFRTDDFTVSTAKNKY